MHYIIITITYSTWDHLIAIIFIYISVSNNPIFFSYLHIFSCLYYYQNGITSDHIIWLYALIKIYKLKESSKYSFQTNLRRWWCSIWKLQIYAKNIVDLGFQISMSNGTILQLLTRRNLYSFAVIGTHSNGFHHSNMFGGA